MPDPGSITPVKGADLTPLTQMMGLASQGLQAQFNARTMDSRVAQAQAQSEQEQNAAQLSNYKVRDTAALQQWMQNPDNWQTNGKVDMDKLNTNVPKIAPYIATEALTHLAGLKQNETVAAQSAQNLTQSQRALIAGPIGVLGRAGIQDPNAYRQEIDNVIAQNPDNKDLVNLGEAYKTTLGMIPPGPHVAQGAVTISQ